MSHSLEQNSGDRELIERLVDGELDHQTRSQWLSSIAVDSSLWRDVAMAFVERQLFDETLGALAFEDESPTRIEVDGAKQIDGGRQLKGAADGSLHRSRVWSWIAGLAACLLLGLLAGFMLNQNDGTAATLVDDPAPSKAVLVQRSVEGQAASPIELADALSRSVAPVPDEFRRALRKAGYSLSDRQRITNVSLPSGGQIELPVRHVDVKFIGISTFQ